MTKLNLEILKLGDGFQILTRIVIEDKECRMLVDTGSSRTLFDKKRMEKFKNVSIKENENFSSSLGGDRIPSEYIIFDYIRLGDKTLENYEGVLFDLRHMNNTFHTNGLPLIDGILGSDILMKYNGVIDYQNRSVELE
jgi:hypothetical protein